MSYLNNEISKIMATDIDTIDLNTRVSDLKRLFAKRKYHHLPVLHKKKLVGIISTADLLNLNIPDYNHDMVEKIIDQHYSIGNIMSSTVITIQPDSTIKEAATLLSSGSFHSLAVTNEDNEFVGMVTSSDLIKYFVDQC